MNTLLGLYFYVNLCNFLGVEDKQNHFNMLQIFVKTVKKL